jgi:hypothetical protein
MTRDDHRVARQRRNPSLAQLHRDAAIGRVGRAKRWMFAGAAGLTAAFAALFSAVAPGRTLSAKGEQAVAPSSTRVSSASSSSNQMPPLASPSSLGLQGPDNVPSSDPSQQSAPSDPSSSQAAPPAPAPAVSGGS